MRDANKAKGTLMLDSKVFNKLHQEIINHFALRYKIDPAIIIDYQLYGFNNFEENLPSIKKMIDEENELFLNGKYLYNKFRQFKNGSLYIKLSREYSFAFFHCLGYKDVYDFLEKSVLITVKDKTDQLAILGKKTFSNDQEFYVGYYLGETKNIIKTKLTFSPRTKEVELVLYYWEAGKLGMFEYYGDIVDLKNNITIYFKKEQSKTGRDAFMCIYYGNEKVINKPILKGLYTGYDTNDRPVTGEIIFQTVNNAEIQEEIAKSEEDVNPIIENYLYNKRLIIDHIIPQNLAEISNYSQYLGLLKRIEGQYTGITFSINREIRQIEIGITKTGKIAILIDKVINYNGYLQIDNSDSVFIGRLINNDNDLKLSIALSGNIEDKLFFTGYLMGSFERHIENCGKFCIAKITDITTETNLTADIQNYQLKDKTFGYSLVFKKMLLNVANEESMVKELNCNATSLNLDTKKLAGEYQLLFYDNEITAIQNYSLKISTSGDAFMQQEQLSFTGDIQIFASGILAINFTKCNHTSYYSQILLFVGKYAFETAKHFKGTANFLNNELKPSAYTVFLIPKNKLENTYNETIFVNNPNYTKLTQELLKIGITMP